MTERGKSQFGPRIALVGTPEEFTRLQRIAQAASAGQSESALALDSILSRFLVATTPARDRAGAATAAASPKRVTEVASRWLPLGIALQAVTLLGAITAGTALLPPRESFDLDRTVMMLVSTIAAVVTVAFAAGGSLLPGWGSADTRRQSWQIHLAGVLVIVVGIVVSVLNRTSDIPEVGTSLWTAWLAANVVAAAAVLVATIARKRWVAGGSGVRPGGRDADAEYFTATASEKSGAVAELEALTESHRDEAKLVDAAWKAGIDKARRVGRVSQRAAESARATSAWRWQLEQAAEPDFAPARRTHG